MAARAFLGGAFGGVGRVADPGAVAHVGSRDRAGTLLHDMDELVGEHLLTRSGAATASVPLSS